MRKRLANCQTIVQSTIYILLMICLSCIVMAFKPDRVEAGTSKDKWTVCQYSGGKRQSMFYTITDKKGRLVIVDGGWRSDADKVKSVIKKYGNTVNAWIITHPHPDHVGALNAILENGSGIRINKIYTCKVDKTHYKKTAKNYDDYSAYVDFMRLTKNKKLIYLQENDELTLIGLKMKVLSSWTRSLRKYNRNVCNYGSLVFRLDGNKDSILFLADVEKKVEKKIIRNHKKELSATYVQCAHHGNWGLSNSFYDYVKAKGAFIDAPSYITSDTTGYYDAPALIKYLKSAKTKVYLWGNTANKVVIK